MLQMRSESSQVSENRVGKGKEVRACPAEHMSEKIKKKSTPTFSSCFFVFKTLFAAPRVRSASRPSWAWFAKTVPGFQRRAEGCQCSFWDSVGFWMQRFCPVQFEGELDSRSAAARRCEATWALSKQQLARFLNTWQLGTRS